MADNPHCSTCRHFAFEGLDLYCKKHSRVISREKFHKAGDGEGECRCGEWVDWIGKEKQSELS